MKPRKYRLPPPTSPACKTGQVLTFTPAAGDPLPSEWIDATPVGPAPLVMELAPEEDKRPSVSPESRDRPQAPRAGGAKDPKASRVLIESSHPCAAWFRSLVEMALAEHPDEFAVFALVVAGTSISDAAAQLCIPVATAADAYRVAQVRFLRVLRNDPFFQLIESALRM